MKRRLLTILLATALGLGLGAATPRASSAGDNVAIAVNTKDGTTVFKVAFAIRHVMGDVVDQSNGAVAYSSCSECASVAVAFEIVLVEGSPSVVTPQNVAIAFNENCDTCVAIAEAYQFVLGTGGIVHFDAEGNRMLSQIRRDLHSLRKEDLTLAELQAKLDAIAAQIADVLANHLVPVGPKRKDETGTQTTSTATTTTTPTTTETTPTQSTTMPSTTTPTTTETSGITTTTGP